MRKLRRMFYLSLLAILGTLVALLLPEVTLLAMVGAATLLIIMRRLMLKRFIQNTRRIYFENRLRFRTGVRAYRDTELEHSSRVCR